MFNGINMTPKSGDVKLIIDHIYKLCGDDDAVVDWVLKWTAYPLQNVGAKMQTALVFHGPEGTGKNIFWDMMLAIYGKWAVTISQSQIETEFNAWMSCKLFVLANEVLSNRERKHIKGRLKAMITEPTILINPKGMAIREESNHANFVFLSNEDQPIDTDSSDRRLMVIESKEVESYQYYKNLKHCITSGGIEAFYDFLLHYDLGDFDTHTKPIMTDAKRTLLNQNLKSEERFIKEWLEGDTCYPVMDVPALSLYWAYRCWCEEHGERYPCSENMFARKVSLTTLIKDRVLLKDSDKTELPKKVIVYFLTNPKDTVYSNDFSVFTLIVEDKKREYRI